ncbi:MAG: hypothetical protein WCS94_18735 [Verrucomicrobiota bacterium]
MGFTKKKADPISDKARALSDEIAALEAEIKRLDSQLQRPTAPRHGSTGALPQSPEYNRHSETPVLPSAVREPVFENINPAKLAPREELPELFNELGVRKYDLPALLRRLRSQFSGPATSNPRLVNYLAAGGVHGLRPLRYEKRVARKRFIWLVVTLAVILYGIFYIMVLSRH